MNILKVSFIVSLLEYTERLKTCIESIQEQRGIEKEIVIVGNKNDIEKSKEILTEIPKKSFIIYKPFEDGETLGAMRNSALDKITGEYICFVSPEDFLEPNSMASLIKESFSDDIDMALGRVFLLNPKTGSYEFKKTANALSGNKPITADGEPDVLKNMCIYNKVFKTSFLRKYNLKLADTNYYDYIPFLVSSMLIANKIATYPKAYYVERLKVGLEGIKNPKLESKIDLNQVSDYVSIVLDMIDNSDDSYSEEAVNIVKDKFIVFVTKRGLKYTNIADNKYSVLEQISKVLNHIEITTCSTSARNKNLLQMIKDKKFDEYFDFLAKEKIAKEKKKNLKVYLTYTAFGKLYNLLSKFPIKKRGVLFVSHSPGMDGNYEYIYDEVTKYNSSVDTQEKFTCKFTTTKGNMFEKIAIVSKLARAEFIILSENVPFFQHLNIRPETKIIQSWHAAGAFKQFGYSTSYMDGGPNPFKNKKMTIHRGYTYATVSSEAVRGCYAEAFDMDIENIIPIGVPRADFFFKEEKVAATKKKINELYPSIVGKKVILYAPTFRGFGKARKKFKLEFDFNNIARSISDDYVIMLKLHPSVSSSNISIDEDVMHKVINASSYNDANDILTVTDLLITDYSSIIFDYSLLGKPMMFYAYDLDEYRVDRDFYYDYESFIPGPMVKTNEEIIETINNNNFDLKKVDAFCEKFFVAKDGKNSERFVKNILLKK